MAVNVQAVDAPVGFAFGLVVVAVAATVGDDATLLNLI